MAGSCITISLEGLDIFQTHDRVFAIRSIVRGLVQGTNREVYETYDIMCEYPSYGSSPVMHKKYLLYISELTDYQQSILRDLGYMVIDVGAFYPKDWSKKLNLN